MTKLGGIRVAALLGRLGAALRSPAGPRCAQCRHFSGSAAALEMQPGMSALSSGHGSVPGHTGLCLKHHCLISRSGGCSEHETIEPASAKG